MTSPPLRVESACRTPTKAPGMILYSRTNPFALTEAAVTPFGKQACDGDAGVPMVDGLICQLLIESLMNLTEPSQKAKLAPPGWKLLGADTNSSVPFRV